MKIFVACSTSFYDKVENIKNELEEMGLEVILPNGYGEDTEIELNTDEEYSNFFKDMFNQSRNKVDKTDAILVLNFDKIKNGVIFKNYIGPSTFLEMYECFMKEKKIYMYNSYDDGIFYDEIKGFNPVILNGDLSKIN